MENKVFDLVNAERVKAGCGKLRNDARLHKAARAYSALMAEKNFFSHTGPDGSSFVDRIAATGYPRSAAAAENIAYGYADAAAVMKGWMDSSGHRANILNCDLKAIGVGLAYRKSTPYWTQDFGRQ
ncbi:MAG: CAP domain-containing protein [Hamadaea sp.]|nr:CAP domain-containing protein [Hamadaea sp.]NUR48019.1 CAP domain-containing protein [Hamadaea sp.]NUT04028.1 CAP domain-containing protein [Hamadaea sp.]